MATGERIEAAVVAVIFEHTQKKNDKHLPQLDFSFHSNTRMFSHRKIASTHKTYPLTVNNEKQVSLHT